MFIHAQWNQQTSTMVTPWLPHLPWFIHAIGLPPFASQCWPIYALVTSPWILGVWGRGWRLNSPLAFSARERLMNLGAPGPVSKALKHIETMSTIDQFNLNHLNSPRISSLDLVYFLACTVCNVASKAQNVTSPLKMIYMNHLCCRGPNIFWEENHYSKKTSYWSAGYVIQH